MVSGQSTEARPLFHLPFEITIEILSRLPVKSLLRFKSVCKDWYALVETPDFISKHLLTHSTPNRTSLLVTTYDRETQNYAMSLVVDDGLSTGPINLDFPFLNRRNYLPIGQQTGINYFYIGGICNGLVCINLSHLGYPLILCNPLTKKFREIPDSKWNGFNGNGYHGYSYTNVNWVSFGFGFHSSAMDYKLIRIVFYASPTREDNVRADLYVMSTDTWREIDVNKLSLFFEEYDFVQILGYSASVVLNGIFYWPAQLILSDEVLLMSFDMGDEVFKKITTPECLDMTWNKANWKFTELNDKLALVISADERAFDVWVLNENEFLWTNQVKLGFQAKLGSFPWLPSYKGNWEDAENTVVGGLKDGELLVAAHKVSGDLKLFLYDTNARKTKDLCFGNVPHESFAYLCAGTLLPVMQVNEIVLNQKNEKRKL
ncbi:F-box protein At3g07870-like [Rhododendron vialii]|uniref:F-box protein At3g07870-like n=1 Tax=Rhododendron vialii TaxID=182163 RepID=UPI00266022C6|nr:F-box protein At3g07870-like [Rhododendron vialii]